MAAQLLPPVLPFSPVLLIGVKSVLRSLPLHFAERSFENVGEVPSL